MVKILRRFVIALVLLEICFAYSAKSWTIFPKLGDERAGTAAMQFLKLGAGAKAAGMGNAVAALADDGFNLYWNPAGLVWSDKRQLALSHNFWVVDLSYDFVGYSMKIGEDQAIGASFIYLGSPEMNVTDEYHPYGTGEKFGFADIAVGISFSQRLTDYFSFGATIKYAQENIENLKMSGMLLDLGTYYQTSFRGTRFAVTLSNFGQQVKPAGSYQYLNPTGEIINKNYQSFSPPTIFRIGLATDVWSSDRDKWQATFQLDHPTDNAEALSMGTEYSFNKMIFFRGGYKFDNDTQTYSLGLGISLDAINSRLDYAFNSISDLGQSNIFSFHWSF
jgi:long-subunit fatty acid transport protein